MISSIRPDWLRRLALVVFLAAGACVLPIILVAAGAATIAPTLCRMPKLVGWAWRGRGIL